MSANVAKYQGSIEHRLYDNDGSVGGTWLAMPDPELANLGRARESGIYWLCGDFIESIVTSSTYLTGYSPLSTEGIPKPPETEESINARCAYRAQKNIRRIVNANRCRFLWTFTFCPANSPHALQYTEPVCNLTQTHYRSVRGLWGRFARKLKQQCDNPKWVLVLELHDSDKTSTEKRGTYHLHFATDEYLSWDMLRVLWGHGNIRFDDFSKSSKSRKGSVNNPGAYMSKYIGKNFDVSNRHLKRFTCSRNITRPRKLSNQEIDRFLQNPVTRIAYQRRREFFRERDDGKGLEVYGVSQTTYDLKGVQL